MIFHLTHNNKTACISYIQEIEADGEYDVEIRKHSNNRTTAQNRLYWMWLHEISSHTGYRKEEIHSYFKQLFLLESEIMAWNDIEVKVIKSTRKLTTKEFTEYLESIEQFANTEIGITLPHPEDIYWRALGYEKAKT